MKINLDSVPSTIEKAVEELINSLDEKDKEFIKSNYSSENIVVKIQGETTEELIINRNQSYTVHFTAGMKVRNDWSLWEKDSPLKRDAVEKYGIAHADDISGLIFSWTWAKIRNEEFDPVDHCRIYHEHWKNYGTNALKAGGWES